MASRVLQRAVIACWLLVILPLAIVLSSLVLSPSSNWTVRTALVGFCVLAISRPGAALLVTTAMVGFGIILSHMAGIPALRVTEVLVVASLAGYCIRALPNGAPFRHALTDSISLPLVLFAIAVVASAVVWHRVHQIESGSSSAYVQALLQFVSRDYFVEPGQFRELVSAAVILEGLGLYLAAAALCRIEPAYAERLLRMLIVGGAGLGALSVVRLAEILLRNPGAIDTLRATSVGLRISPQIPDYIAAGSYFALCWVAAIGLALASSGRRLLWVATGVPSMAALYLTGSRSVIAAAVAGLIALMVFVVRQKSPALRRVIVFAVLAVAVMVFSYRWMSGRDFAGEMARQSLTVRTELIRTGFDVIASRPLFGIGLDRFYLLAGALASPQLRALWPGRMNPHNDFLRIGAELGLIGLALFLWILAAAGRRIWHAARWTHDPRLAGVAGGLVAFLVTSLVSNPLMVRDVSYVFWIALGLAVGRSASLHAPADVAVMSESSKARRHIQLQYAGASLVAGLLVFSIPFRARQELATVDPARVSYGLFDGGLDAGGTKYRLSGPHATFFVNGRARMFEMPLRGTLPSGALQQVELRIDGRVANRIVVGPQWARVRTLLPESSIGSRRIDLVVSPSWVPAEVIPGSQDRRELGVEVGEVTINLDSR